jgi:D-glycero-alpha-D-manno-heptose-7-phosphate kinase
MIYNTEAQNRLHPSLISPDAETVIDIAESTGALGWKVNGAGGDGGSLTVLCGPDVDSKLEFVRLLRRANPRFEVIPTHLSLEGLRVWEARLIA